MDGPIFSTVAGAHASVPKTKPLDEFEHLTTKAQLWLKEQLELEDEFTVECDEFTEECAKLCAIKSMSEKLSKETKKSSCSKSLS